MSKHIYRKTIRGINSISILYGDFPLSWLWQLSLIPREPWHCCLVISLACPDCFCPHRFGPLEPQKEKKDQEIRSWGRLVKIESETEEQSLHLTTGWRKSPSLWHNKRVAKTKQLRVMAFLYVVEHHHSERRPLFGINHCNQSWMRLISYHIYSLVYFYCRWWWPVFKVMNWSHSE